MNPTKTTFSFVKNSLSTIEISIGPVLTDVGQMYDPPNPGPDMQEIQSLVFFGRGNSIFTFAEPFAEVRKEVLSNLTMPIEPSVNKSYLKEIFDLYSELEARIVEDEFGVLSTDLVTFVGTSYEKMLDFHKDEYKGFLSSLKETLRNEIFFLSKQIKYLEMNNSVATMPDKTSEVDIIWKRDKVDLIELVRALKLIGAINNPTNNLTFDKAYKFFGDIFNSELKNPEDQLRQRAETLDAPNFLEELLDIYKKDQIVLKKRRES